MAACTAEEVIAGFKQIISRVHAAGLKILVGTLTPFKNFTVLPGYWTELGEAKRQTINEWIRTSNLHDGVIDFDQVVRDPADPESLLPVFDSGDHAHLSPAGYAAMEKEAERVLLLPGRRHIKGHLKPTIHRGLNISRKLHR